MKRFILIAAVITNILFCAITVYGAVPSVVSTSPDGSNGAPVAVDVPISISFSEIVTWATISNDGTSNYSIKIFEDATNTPFNAIAFAPQVDDSSYVLTLTSDLKYGTTYRVEVSSSVRSAASDNSMLANYVFTFTTESSAHDHTPPTVNSFLPASNSTGNPLDSTVVIDFSEPMDPLTLTSSSIFLKDKNNAVVPATLSYDSTMNAVTLTPNSLLSLDGVYYLNVTTAVKDLAGNAMAAALAVNPGFKTVISDTIPPTTVSTNPTSGATGITTDTVRITFSEAMMPSTINTTNIVVKGPSPATTQVAGIVSYDQGSLTASFTATSGFTLASDYTVTVSTGVKDLAGNAMAANKTFSFTTARATSAAPMSNYALIPAFIMGGTVKPNVLLILDNSGSMSSRADATTTYVPTTTYYGYFNSNKMYSYTASGTNSGWSPNSNVADRTKVMSAAVTDSTSGNFLNWLLTSRIDALKMVMVSGTTDAALNRVHYSGNDVSSSLKYGAKTYTTLQGSGKFQFKVKLGSSSSYTTFDTNVRITAADLSTDMIANPGATPGLIRLFKDQMNMGIMYFNSSANGGYVAIKIGATNPDFVGSVLAMTPSTNTPLAETLLEAVAYFKGGNSLYNSGVSYSGTNDPMKYGCAKNYVVMVTDGEPTSDQNLPGSNWPPSSGAITVANAGFTIKDYMDGRTTTPKITGIKALDWGNTSRMSTKLLYNGSSDMQGTWYLPAVAYYAHTTDLRPAFGNTQNMDIYTVFAFDDSPNAKELLKLAAKYGGFDLGGYDPSQTTNTAVAAPDATSKYDKDNGGAGDGVPDNYFEANNGQDMIDALDKTFKDILARAASGTAASILNNSEGSGANLLQAVFYPKKSYENAEISWTGELQNLWYYLDPQLKNSTIRVDSVSDNKLNLKDDNIAQFYFDTTALRTKVKLFTDLNGDGIADPGSDLGPYDPDDYDHVKSLWRAGKLLWDRNLSTNPRTIYTRTGGLADTSAKAFDDPTTGLAKFSNVVESGYASKLTAETNFQNMLQAANTTEADKIVKYIHGVPETDGSGNMIDVSGYRSRLVKIGTSFGIWKLGDIVASTPKMVSNLPLNTYAAAPPMGYNDSTYDAFVKSADYQNRGMAFVGSNDGMLHAFKLGTLTELHTGFDKARLDGTGLGQERWAFIPRNTLPYLTYLTNTAYSHLNYIDGSSTLIEASIHAPSDNDAVKYPGCDSAHYWKCKKKTVTTGSTKALDMDKTSWRTILIGATGLGGASRNNANSGYCYASTTGTDCVKTPVDGVGYSTYFALDVTDPENPKFLWEFNGNPLAGASADKKGGNLGYATSGPVIIREGDKDKNGRWFAVFGSGPTGAIDSSIRQFSGRSDQPLSFFVVDLGTGKLVKTIDTGISNAFSGSLASGSIDTDKSNLSSAGFYKDDTLYAGYTQKTTNTTWYSGGVVRVSTNESEYPDTSEDADAGVLNKPWSVSTVIDGIGPVTSSVTKLQDRSNKKLWLYFGSGRYFYKDLAGVDDAASQRAMYGVQEPCYSTQTNDIDQSCTTKVATSTLTEQTTIQAIPADSKGWFVNLELQAGDNDSERVITDPVASPNGVVYFTTFKPTSNVCEYGGASYIWALNYATGGTPPSRAMQGKLLMQVSTGTFAEISMADAFGAKDGRRITDSVSGVPPKAQGLSVLTNPKPVRKILHIQER